tara:strand:- start:39 stop:239 length:201 start_codon:yes stop_codon:yes gene_type:complete
MIDKDRKYESGYCSARYYKGIRIHIKNNGFRKIYTIDDDNLPAVQSYQFYQAKMFIDKNGGKNEKC